MVFQLLKNQPWWRRSVENLYKLSRCCCVTLLPKRARAKFAVDSLLEGEGFEPSVPRHRTLFETAPFELAFPTGRERDRGFDPGGHEARCRSATASPATSKWLAPRCRPRLKLPGQTV